MRNVLLTGVGGQGTVLAAKVLAQAAQAKGWQFALPGRSVWPSAAAAWSLMFAWAITGGSDRPACERHRRHDLIAFEPAEAARVLPYLAPDGVMVSATRPSSLSRQPFRPSRTLPRRRRLVGRAPHGCVPQRPPVPSSSMRPLSQWGEIALNTVLAFALKTGHCRFFDDSRDAIRACVKPRFVELNLRRLTW